MLEHDVYVVRQRSTTFLCGIAALVSLVYLRDIGWPWLSIVLASLAIRSLWLRVLVDTSGVEVTTMFRHKRLKWQDIEWAELTDGIWAGSRKIRLHYASGYLNTFSFPSGTVMRDPARAVVELHAVIEGCLTQFADAQEKREP